MNKQVDMSKFIGQEFDCEFRDLLEFGLGYTWHVSHLKELRELKAFGETAKIYDGHRSISSAVLRPRLNKPQVLDSWDWVPDGLVWRVDYYNEIAEQFYTERCESSYLREMHENGLTVVLNVQCIGVDEEYKNWGAERNMPAIKI